MAAVVYGLTDLGFVRKPLRTIRDDLNASLRAAFGNSMSLNDRSIFGIIVGILAERFSQLWEILETIASSQDPDKAVAALLDALCTLTGTFRPGPQPSVAILTLTGVDATDIASGTRARTLSTGKEFETQTDVTITAVDAWNTGTLYALDDRVTHVGNVYQCIQAGTSDITGPIGEETDETTDGTVLWTFLGEGEAAVDVEAHSVDDGPVTGEAKDIAEFGTPITGWQGVTNVNSAVLGRLVASDAELRLLREQELAAAGSSPFDALIANLLQVSGVTAVNLFVNNTDLTNSDGVPPHAVEALVTGGADQDIFDTLLASVAAGIATHGNTTGTSADSQGTAQTENFSRVSEIPVYASLTVEVDDDLYPADGDDQIASGLVSFGAVQASGRDSVPVVIASQALLVAGVLDVTEVLVYTDVIGSASAWTISHAYVATPGSRSVVSNDGGRKYICITSGTSAGSGGPTGTGTDITDGTAHWRFLGNKVAITTRQRATYSLAHTTVSSSSGTP